MKFLITGGAGFIGSHLTEKLLAVGHQVSIIDDLSTGNLRNLDSVKDSPNLEIVIGDVISHPELEPLIRKSDVVCHLAAAVGVELVVHDPIRTIMTNVSGTERVLRLASLYEKKCVVASTSEVYGKSDKPLFSESDDLLIGAPTNSRWSYACSKLLDEFMVMAYNRNQAFRGSVVRFFNTVGPRQTGRYGMVVPRFVSAALQNKNLLVYGDGSQTRCFCHVQDTIRALYSIMMDENAVGQIYNIGSQRSISIRELAELVISRLRSLSKIEIVPYSKAYEQGFEDMHHRVPDVSKVNQQFSWRAEYSLEQIIDDVSLSLQK